VAEAHAPREYGLDAARGILMGLGVFLHAANVYSPGSDWLVSDPQSHAFFSVLAQWIHVFRMPAFFWISGYFCALTFTRQGAIGMWRARAPRLFIPLVVTCLTLNVAQDLLVGRVNAMTATEVLSAGFHLHHLWFLVDLIVFTGLAVLALPLLSKYDVARRFAVATDRLGVVVLVTLCAYSLEIGVRISTFAYEPLLGLTTAFELASYLPYFAIGVLMYGAPGPRGRLLALPTWAFVPAVAAAAWLDPTASGATSWCSEAARLLQLACVWVCIGALLGYFGRVFQRANAFTRTVSDAAYSVYLFHHIVVVAMGLALVGASWGPWVKFCATTLVAIAFPMVLHMQLIRRIGWLRLLFNGR
jgi:glucans biosynthesis protein C